MSHELYSLEMGDPPIERVYPLPTADAFRTVNAAVFYALSRLYPWQQIARDETEGAIVYHLTGWGWRAQLFVLYTTDRVATMRFHPLMPDNPVDRAAWVYGPAGAAAGQQMLAIFERCHSSVVNLLRRTTIDVQPPDIPHDLEAALVVQEIYYETMPDSELAKLVGVEHQTVRNRRRELGRPKAIRGKRRKEST